MQNFFGFVPRSMRQSTMVNDENINLLNNIRADIIGELDAINQYSVHMAQSTNSQMTKVWRDIRSEEQVHVGELMYMLFKLDPESYENYKMGLEEAEKLTSKQ